MKFKYEDLEIYQLAMDLVDSVYELTNYFPKEEMFGLTSQARRAVTSICLNIAEGYGRFFKKDFARFIRNAIASLLETDAIIKIALRRKFVTEEQVSLSHIYELEESLFYKLIAFEKSLIGDRKNEDSYV